MKTLTPEEIQVKLKEAQSMLNAVECVDAGECQNLTLKKIGLALANGDCDLIPTKFGEEIIMIFGDALQHRINMLSTDLEFSEVCTCPEGKVAE
jgi:hypothetical protein